MSDRRPMCSRQSGFTASEMAATLVTIVILVAVLMPRLLDIQHEARIAKAKSLEGILGSAADMARSRCEIDLATGPKEGQANCASPHPVVFMNGRYVDMVHRYPAATEAGIDAAARIDPDSDGFMALSEITALTRIRSFDVAGGMAPGCRVSYREAVPQGDAVVAPLISVTTNGC